MVELYVAINLAAMPKGEEMNPVLLRVECINNPIIAEPCTDLPALASSSPRFVGLVFLLLAILVIMLSPSL
jgi:hypothetical protein